MAFSDWTISLVSNNVASHSAVVNSALSNPLTVGGGFCRLLTGGAGDGTIDGYAFARLSNAYASGAFLGVPNTRAIRIQACVRITGQAGGFNGIQESLVVAKAPQTFSAASCYGLGVRDRGQPSTVSLVLRTGGGSVTTIQSAAKNTWYSVRMDVFPLGTGGDQIRSYLETSPGSGTWTLINTTTIASNASNYIAWGGTTVQGIVHNVDYDGGATSSGCQGFFDLFQCYVAPAP
jgi:hypothetical protein